METHAQPDKWRTFQRPCSERPCIKHATRRNNRRARHLRRTRVPQRPTSALATQAHSTLSCGVITSSFHLQARCAKQ